MRENLANSLALTRACTGVMDGGFVRVRTVYVKRAMQLGCGSQRTRVRAESASAVRMYVYTMRGCVRVYIAENRKHEEVRGEGGSEEDAQKQLFVLASACAQHEKEFSHDFISLSATTTTTRTRR